MATTKPRPLDVLLKIMEEKGGTINRTELLNLLDTHHFAVIKRAPKGNNNDE